MKMFRCVLTFVIWVVFTVVWLSVPWHKFVNDDLILKVIIIGGLICNFGLAVWLGKNTVDWTDI